MTRGQKTGHARWFASMIWLGVAGSAGATVLVAGTGSRLWIDGDSTLHAFRCVATFFTASLDETESGRVAGGLVEVPVAVLHSGKAGLDERLRLALDATHHPLIALRINPAGSDAGSAGETGPVSVTGRLTIVGATRELTVTGTGVAGERGIRVRGTRALDMRDWGIVPPALLLGTLRVRPVVIVGFDLEFTRRVQP